MSNVVQFPGQVDQETITINFLERVLPPHGLYCACVKRPGGGFVQTFHETIDSLWRALYDADRNGKDVYFAPASFSSNDRTIDALAERQCLAIDVDYGQGHARPGYATFEEARDALKDFCGKVPLPTPMVVKSGGGFHAYWTFEAALSRDQWRRYAEGLKAACIEHGLKADHGLTINPVHILRVPGTFNRKLAQPRPVELDPGWLKFGPYEWPEALLQFRGNVVALKPSRLPPRPAYLDGFALPSQAFPDRVESVVLATLAETCGVVKSFQSSGDQCEPTWMRLANLYHYVEDGERLFHEHSANGYAKYDRQETQKKWDRANALTGPPLCEGFKDNTDEKTRAICLACPLLDRIKTPIQGVENDSREPGVLLPRDDIRGPASSSPSVVAKKPPYVEWDKTEKGTYRATFKNTGIAISKLDLTCTHDTFHMKKFVNGEALDDTVARGIREQIISRFRFDPGKDHVGEALNRECERNAFDPVLDYIANLKWDGFPRLDRWLIYYLGADETELNQAFARKILLAACRRVRRRGCKFDHMLILEGPQGAGKSSAWQILASPENFSDAQIKWDDPKQQRENMGAWIHEVSELVGLRKADVDAIKSFLSRQVDRGRSAYDRFPSDQPRRGIIVGTINPRAGVGYLTDPTGARRFWPVKVGDIHLEALKEDRDQLWAEAAHYEALGEPLELPQHLWAAAADEQNQRRSSDPWDDILAGVTGDRISSLELFERYVGQERARMTPTDAGRVAAIMRRLGWDGPKVMWIDGKTMRGYERSS